MIGDQLFEERREEIRDAAMEYHKRTKRALPEHCERCQCHREIGLLETRLGEWVCFDCFRARIDELEAERKRVLGMMDKHMTEQEKVHSAMREAVKSMNLVFDLVLRRIDHVETPSNRR